MIVYRIDTTGLQRAGAAIVSELKADKIVTHALNDVGHRVYTQVKRDLSDRLGVKVSRVAKVLREWKATATHQSYDLIARDQYLSLKEFSPTQVKAGTKATWYGERHLFPHAFIGEGSLNEHVYVRTHEKVIASKGRYKGKLREKLHRLSGPAIPNEMVKEAEAKVVEGIVARDMPGRIEFWTHRAMEKAAARAKHG